ncbi:hypothetical protein PVIIG_03765 [Plasmodium vivax India VII]|uniref:Variable surface protein Vir35 n=1 Tax=Plasmodium vivax India VII TaxID=1077284 RepID=A0A0J9SG74_PLAVI|nr:hypothetical protein PVIIG_03765 [Plasmodium vivax India VII]
MDKTGLYKNSPYFFENKAASNYDDYVSIYGNIKNRDSKKLKLYKTAYKHRYAKKKGLSKLDCYYEKKIFDKFDYINEIRNNMQNDKKSFKKKIYHKYGYGLIIFSLLPVLGLIIPLFFNEYNPLIQNWCFSGCEKGHGITDNTHNNNYIKKDIDITTWTIIEVTNSVFLCISVFIVIFVLLYILSKFVKYERLKSGKGKMKGKEYFNYCMEVLDLKKK